MTKQEQNAFRCPHSSTSAFSIPHLKKKRESYNSNISNNKPNTTHLLRFYVYNMKSERII